MHANGSRSKRPQPPAPHTFTARADDTLGQHGGTILAKATCPRHCCVLGHLMKTGRGESKGSLQHYPLQIPTATVKNNWSTNNAWPTVRHCTSIARSANACTRWGRYLPWRHTKSLLSTGPGSMTVRAIASHCHVITTPMPNQRTEQVEYP